jgi:SAM-dependent methyltransferase
MALYTRPFAQVYNRWWAGFAAEAAPRLWAFYAAAAPGRAGRPVLDLCCGSGQLARHFLEHGARLTGLDLSPAMLAHAAENNAAFVAAGRARFVAGDAADFDLGERFGLVVSTYDALNHLDGLPALQSCFRSVRRALDDDGLFIFDLNTRRGLGLWCGQAVHEREDAVYVLRGHWNPEGTRAEMRVTGFTRQPNGLYERFEQQVFNTLFALDDVQAALAAAGLGDAYPARLEALEAPLAAPEDETRVFFVARPRP